MRTYPTEASMGQTVMNFSQGHFLKQDAFKIYRDNNEFEKREKQLLKMDKWKDFRRRRLIEIDLFCAAKGKSIYMAEFIKQCFLRQILIMLWLNYKDWKFIVLLRIKGTFISNVLGKIWRQNRRKRGNDVEFIHKNNLRREFTYVVVVNDYQTR